VFITNSGAYNILVYHHNGTAMPTISDPGGEPVGCTYDSLHHQFAVSNIVGTAGYGNIALYNEPCCSYASPTIITDPSFGSMYFLGFRPNSTLFVDGYNSLIDVSYWKLTYPTYPFAQLGFTPANLIGVPGGVQ